MKYFLYLQIYLTLIIIILSCSSKESEIEKISIRGKSILKEDLINIKKKVINNGNNVNVLFVNNPVNLQSSDTVVFFFNEKVAYFGEYKNNFISSFPKNLQEGYRVHFAVHVLRREKSNKISQYIIQNKSVCYWSNDFKYLYIGFFPTNQEIDRVHFFPQRKTVIQ